MIALISAVADNNCIGKNNQLPWHIPEDLKHFKELTSKKTVLMGRKTFESILGYLGKPLPKRKNIVITRSTDYQVPNGAEVYNNIQQAFADHENEDIFVIGGAGIYAQTIDLADTLYITHVRGLVEGDAFFPKIDTTIWKEVEREDHNGYSFVTYKK
ncbi:MAG: dihydrofolate reductase [bacterium]